jgi:hypothetical protein
MVPPPSRLACFSQCLACYRKRAQARFGVTGPRMQPPLTLGDDQMKTSATRIALGLFIATASLAASKTASAQTYVRWENASQPNGNIFFLGVSGGPQCDGNRCAYSEGTQIITYQYGQLDQEWTAAVPGTGPVTNLYGDPVSGAGYVLAVAGNSTSDGANLVIWPSDGSLGQTWEIEAVAGAYSGCYVFRNPNSGKVMSVSGGTPYNGAHVIQYDFCQPGSPACGNPANAYHPDQFWCPEDI